MRYSIAICLGVDQVIAAGRDYAQALSVAGCRLSGALAKELWSELPEYNGEQGDGQLSWIRCTEAVVREYGMHCNCAEVVCFAEPYFPRYWFKLAHHKECWFDNGEIALKAERREPGLEVLGAQGLDAVYGPDRPIFDVRGRS